MLRTAESDQSQLQSPRVRTLLAAAWGCTDPWVPSVQRHTGSTTAKYVQTKIIKSQNSLKQRSLDSACSAGACYFSRVLKTLGTWSLFFSLHFTRCNWGVCRAGEREKQRTKAEVESRACTVDLSERCEEGKVRGRNKWGGERERRGLLQLWELHPTKSHAFTLHLLIFFDSITKSSGEADLIFCIIWRWQGQKIPKITWHTNTQILWNPRTCIMCHSSHTVITQIGVHCTYCILWSQAWITVNSLLSTKELEKNRSNSFCLFNSDLLFSVSTANTWV